VVKEYPDQRLYIVPDNLNTHTNEAATKWLEAHPLVSFHYTPTHASWVNLIEGFFSILTGQGLQQAVHQSAKEDHERDKDHVYDVSDLTAPCGALAGAPDLPNFRRLVL